MNYCCSIIVLSFPYTSFCNKNINVTKVFWYYRVLPSLECFDILAKMWVETVPLVVVCMNAAATKFQDLIWVAGGMRAAQNNSLCRNVNCYDVQHNV